MPGERSMPVSGQRRTEPPEMGEQPAGAAAGVQQARPGLEQRDEVLDHRKVGRGLVRGVRQHPGIAGRHGVVQGHRARQQVLTHGNER